jgi:hypothetical protein
LNKENAGQAKTFFEISRQPMAFALSKAKWGMYALP